MWSSPLYRVVGGMCPRKLRAPSGSLERMFDTRQGASARLARARDVLAATEARVGVGPGAGEVVCAGGTRPQVFAAVARAMGPHGWVGVVGVADVGWLAAAEHGIALDRVLYVPHTRGLDTAVLTAVVDSCAVVVAGALRLAPAHARAVIARAHARGTTLFTLTPWPGVRTREVG